MCLHVWYTFTSKNLSFQSLPVSTATMLWSSTIGFFHSDLLTPESRCSGWHVNRSSSCYLFPRGWKETCGKEKKKKLSSESRSVLDHNQQVVSDQLHSSIFFFSCEFSRWAHRVRQQLQACCSGFVVVIAMASQTLVEGMMEHASIQSRKGIPCQFDRSLIIARYASLPIQSLLGSQATSQVELSPLRSCQHTELCIDRS